MFIIYSALLYLSSIFFFPYLAVRLALKGKSRAGLMQRLGFLGPGLADGPGRPGRKAVWVHAVSVGETLAAVPIVKALSERHPDLIIFFSTVTETGNAVANENIGSLARIFFFPFDFPFSVHRVLRVLRPDVFVIVETELWPNALKAVYDSGAQALMVNGRISPRSFKGYGRVRFFMRRVLALISFFNMQTAQDAKRIVSLGASEDRVSVAGNVKFDQALGKGGPGQGFTRGMLGIPEASVVMVAGSTHEGEEEEALAAYRRLLGSFPDSILIIAPRHPERFRQVEELIRKEGFKCYPKSAFKVGKTLPVPGVMLLDTMGELAGVYAIGDINFVGGSWAAVGGHNVLEPAAFGKPVFFGPYMHNFQEISRILKECGAGIEVTNGMNLAGEAVRLLNDPPRMRALGLAAKEVLMRNRGALGKNVELIERYLYP